MILGFVGLIGCGKGAASDILVNKHGFIKESFANGVKDATAPIFGWDRAMLEGDTEESRIWRETPDSFWSEKLGKPFTPRLALQLMGTDAGRNVFHPDLWVHSLLKRVDPNKNYVIADVRFPNEIDMVKKAGGKVIRIVRGPEPAWFEHAKSFNYITSFDGSKQTMKDYPDVHYSEWAWVGKSFDGVIRNEGTLKELEENVDQLIKNSYNINSTQSEAIK